MNLRDYLTRENKSMTEFAAQIGIFRGYLQQIIAGNRQPGKKLARLISDHTGGEVSVEELRPYNFHPPLHKMTQEQFTKLIKGPIQPYEFNKINRYPNV